MNNTIHQIIAEQIQSHPIVLYMKGSADQPQCGYSAQVIQILTFYQVNYKTFNVLENDALRAGIKSFTQWPTIPQLYIKGEFIGGCDIITQLHDENKLMSILDENQ